MQEWTPKTVTEAVQLEDEFIQAHKQASIRIEEQQVWTDERDQQRDDKIPLANKQCFSCEQVGSCVIDKEMNGPSRSVTADGTQPSKPNVKCYNCERKGHVAIRFHSWALCGLEKPQPRVYQQGQVKGMWVGNIFLDMACMRMLVHNRLVPPSCIQEGRVTTIAATHITDWYNLPVFRRGESQQ